jgi:hypothetical protein
MGRINMRNTYGILTEKFEGKRLLEGSRCRREDNIRTDLRVGRCGLDASGSG